MIYKTSLREWYLFPINCSFYGKSVVTLGCRNLITGLVERDVGFDQNQKLGDRGAQRCVTHKEDVTTGIIIKLSNNRISESDQKEIVALNSGNGDRPTLPGPDTTKYRRLLHYYCDLNT